MLVVFLLSCVFVVIILLCLRLLLRSRSDALPRSSLFIAGLSHLVLCLRLLRFHSEILSRKHPVLAGLSRLVLLRLLRLLRRLPLSYG